MFGLSEMYQGLYRGGTAISISECRTKDNEKGPFSLKNVRAVSSYSWVDGIKSTLQVPGSPPEVKGMRLPFRLAKDTGREIIDINRFRMPSAPFAALMASVQYLEPNYRWPELDILTDRNSLRKLLRWLTGKVDRNFRIDLQLVGNKTVVFSRWEEKAVLESHEHHGYGHNFEVAYTKTPIGHKLLGHFRVVEYQMDGVKLLIRFEVDACLPVESKQVNLDELAAGLEALDIKKEKSTKKVDSTDFLPLVSIIPSGSLVPQEKLVEVTSRSQKSFDTFDWGDPYPQLFLSQTPHLHIAIHRMGNFTQINKYKLNEGRLKEVHAAQEKNFRRLRVLLGIILDKARKSGVEKRLTLVCQRGSLTLHENLDGKSVLPDDHLALFSLTESGGIK